MPWSQDPENTGHWFRKAGPTGGGDYMGVNPSIHSFVVDMKMTIETVICACSVCRGKPSIRGWQLSCAVADYIYFLHPIPLFLISILWP